MSSFPYPHHPGSSDSQQHLSSASVGGGGPGGAAAQTEAARDDRQHQRPQPELGRGGARPASLLPGHHSVEELRGGGQAVQAAHQGYVPEQHHRVQAGREAALGEGRETTLSNHSSTKAGTGAGTTFEGDRERKNMS